jgi:phosphoglucomutase
VPLDGSPLAELARDEAVTSIDEVISDGETLKLSSANIGAKALAGDPVEAILTSAPGNGAPIGGLKVISAKGCFAARPSGTEEVYKLYAESFSGPAHLQRIQAEARALINDALARCGAQRR